MSDKFQRIDFVEFILPEIVWIGFLLEFHGDQDGIRLATRLIEITDQEVFARPKPVFSLISAHRLLSSEDKERICKQLHQDDVLSKLRAGLGAFIRCYSDENPLAYLWCDEPIEAPSSNDLELARATLSPRLNRWSQKGTVMQAVVLYGEAVTGRLHYPSDLPPPNLESIFDEFASPEGQRASGHVRTMTTMLYSSNRERLGTTWAEYFWKRGFQIDPPQLHIEIENWSDKEDPLQRFRHDFSTMASMLVKELSKKLLAIPLFEEEHTVINGLIARQATVAIAVAENINVWNWDIGPLYLRAMTDCYITLAWILRSVRERSQLYILHGLSQEKLWMAHYEKIIEKIEDPEEKQSCQQMLEASKAWVESQSFLFFVTVNLGSWSGKPTRQMAEEADCLDLYNFAYQPYSFCAHNTWNHVGKFNAIASKRPLNKNMRLPRISSYGGEPSIVTNAAKYLEKAARVVMEAFSLQLNSPPPHSWTCERLEEISRWAEQAHSTKTNSATCKENNKL